VHIAGAVEVDEALRPGGQLEYARKLKEQGKARFIGMSSHVADVSARMVETGALDVLMFPVNPAFDMLSGIDNIDDLFAQGVYDRQTGSRPSADRARLYRACEAHGTSIVTMKTFAAGWLLQPGNMSGMTLTPTQCVSYALSRPSVASTLIGCKTRAEVEAALHYLDATDAEHDFSSIHQAAGKWNMEGVCMYCNHCLPCPSLIDIAAVTQALDMFDQAPEAAKARYAQLRSPASSCIECGSCESACPFHVDVIGNMKRAAALFE